MKTTPHQFRLLILSSVLIEIEMVLEYFIV